MSTDFTDGRLHARDRWPEIFAELDHDTAAAVETALVDGWHEGWTPTREEVQDLADEARGLITPAEYLTRAAARARAASGGEAG
ncbi:hypothetical protein [Arthrobacter sp. RCC_34]|uniref:antitoxin VbhA family protein n=1 Tax=Arthrobacter sp. RCC_34 TaxID=3239230 RepID=UPI0035237E9C